MHFSSPRRLVLVLLAVFSSTTVFARDSVPLRGASAPSLEEAAQVINAARSDAEGLIKLTHIVNPTGLIFQTITPCRLLDTRNAPGPFGGPIFANGETRTYDPAQGVSITCGGSSLPDALAWYANITVTGTTFGPSLLTAFPTGTTRPNVATVNWATAGAQVNNSVIVPTGTSSAFDVYVGTSTHVIVDLVGFFTADLSQTGDQLAIITDRGNGAAVLGQNNSNTNGSHGVGGFVSGTGTVHGVQGQTSSAATGDSSGVHGINGSTGSCTSGVRGESGTAIPCLFFGPPGILGTSSGFWGVLGLSSLDRGVQGSRTNAAGTFQTSGVLGFSGTSGVHSFSDVTAGGAKPFVEPHPTDASKEIVYISVEANEALTMTRGRSKTQRGVAKIELPDDFKMVTEEEGLSVQVTPIGSLASVAVLKVGLDGIVVQTNRDVDFFYTVTGIRHHYARHKAIQENVHFIPASATAKMDPWPEATQKTLIKLGIYNEDRSVNMETARWLGWDKIWAARSEKELKEKSN